MNIKEREIKREEYLELEEWLEENLQTTMTVEYLLEELTLFNQEQIRYIIMAFMIPKKEIEKELEFYDSIKSLNKPDEIFFVNKLASKYSTDKETIIERIKQVRILKEPQKKRINIKKRKKTQK